MRMKYRTDGGLLSIRQFEAETKVCETIIRCVLYRDGCTLFVQSKEKLQHMAIMFAKASRKFELPINEAKRYIYFNHPQEYPACQTPTSLLMV